MQRRGLTVRFTRLRLNNPLSITPIDSESLNRVRSQYGLKLSRQAVIAREFSVECRRADRETVDSGACDFADALVAVDIASSDNRYINGVDYRARKGRRIAIFPPVRQ